MDRIIKRTESEIQRLQRKLQRSIYVYGNETPEKTMTTPDTNTVFLVAEVAPEEVKAPERPEIPERCETGERLGKARSAAVKAATTPDEFYVVEGRGWMTYIKHVISCPVCLEWEQSKGRMVK